MQVFARMMEELAARSDEQTTVMIPFRDIPLRNALPGRGRDLSEGAPHGLGPAGERGGVAG